MRQGQRGGTKGGYVWGFNCFISRKRSEIGSASCLPEITHVAQESKLQSFHQTAISVRVHTAFGQAGLSYPVHTTASYRTENPGRRQRKRFLSLTLPDLRNSAPHCLLLSSSPNSSPCPPPHSAYTVPMYSV